MISPNEAKKACSTSEVERRKEHAIKIENYIDNFLKARFSGKPIILSRSAFHRNEIPYKDDLVSEILEKYRRAGWCVKISESCSEYGSDLHLTFSENTGN